MSVHVRELTDDKWTIAIPARLELLLKIHAGSVKYPLEEPIDPEEFFVSEFLKRGLITGEFIIKQQVHLSERGRKLVEMILATPLPLHAWTDPRGEEVME